MCSKQRTPQGFNWRWKCTINDTWMHKGVISLKVKGHCYVLWKMSLL